MSSVSAVTQDISFTAKVASFTPLNNDLLIKQFAAWLQERSTEQNFIVLYAAQELRRLRRQA